VSTKHCIHPAKEICCRVVILTGITLSNGHDAYRITSRNPGKHCDTDGKIDGGSFLSSRQLGYLKVFLSDTTAPDGFGSRGAASL
jgi:hypothetical protein